MTTIRDEIKRLLDPREDGMITFGAVRIARAVTALHCVLAKQILENDSWQVKDADKRTGDFFKDFMRMLTGDNLSDYSILHFETQEFYEWLLDKDIDEIAKDRDEEDELAIWASPKSIIEAWNKYCKEKNK